MPYVLGDQRTPKALIRRTLLKRSTDGDSIDIVSDATAQDLQDCCASKYDEKRERREREQQIVLLLWFDGEINEEASNGKKGKRKP